MAFSIWENRDKGFCGVTFTSPGEQLPVENHLQLCFSWASSVLTHPSPTEPPPLAKEPSQKRDEVFSGLSGGWGCPVSPSSPSLSPPPPRSPALLPRDLQCANIQVISEDACDRAYGSAVTNNMFCAGVPQGGVDSCQVRGGGGVPGSLGGGRLILGWL